MTRCRGLISIEIEVINRLDFFKMYKRGIFILFACISCLLTAQSAWGQFTISGTVKDKTDDSPLPQVSIRLLSARDSSFVTGVSSKNDGTFALTVKKAGNYLAAFSFLGYKTTYEPVRLTANQRRRNIGTVLLESNDILLQEAVVVGKAPEVVVKEDTVEFNADSYKTQPNSVVEDLLKKLPGVEVDSEGKITHAGKEITKILVDGKEFFSDDPKIATKNLPVDIVEKLQVVDRKSDLARLTGVDDGEEETVINLTIKKGMKHGWFGNVSGGYGLDGRYEAGAMINRFFGDNQITILAGSNNTNNMGFTDLGGSRFRRFGGMNGINTSHNVGVNFNVGKGEEFRVGGDVSYNNSNRNVLQRTERQNLFADSTSYYSGHNKMNDHGQNIRGNFRIHWEIDSLNTLEFRPKFAVALSRSDSYDSALTTAGDLARSKVNFSESDNFNKGTGYDLSGELIYNHKFLSRPGRSFSIQAEYKFSDTKEDGWTKALYKYYQLATDSTLDQIDDNHTWSNGYGARLTWTEPLGDVKKGRFLTFSYRFQANFNNADKYTYDVFTDPLTALPLDTLRNDDLSNSFRNNYYMHRAQVGFKQVKPTYTYDVGVAVEADAGALAVEGVGGVEGVEGVAEVLGAVERGVDDGEAHERGGEGELAEPTGFILADVAAGPLDDAGGVGLEIVEIDGRVGAVVVVVALDDLAAKLADAADALGGGGVVADDVTKADDVIHALGLGVGKDGVEGLDVGVDVADDGVSAGTWHKGNPQLRRRMAAAMVRSMGVVILGLGSSHLTRRVVSPAASRRAESSV